MGLLFRQRPSRCGRTFNPGDEVEKQPIKVLLVDDDQGDFEMIRVMLGKAEHQAFEVEWVSTFEEALDAFGKAAHDVYFLDYFLEDRTGLDLLKEAKARGITAPIIMLTGRGSRTVDMEAMDMGASDYLVKGLIDPDALERAVRHALEREEGSRAIKKLEEAGRAAPAAGPAVGGAASPATSPPSSDALSGDSARFRALFESTRSGVALVGLDGRVLEVNSAFTRLFAPSLGWGEGGSYLDLLVESDRDAVEVELTGLSRGERARFEAARRYLGQDGGVIWAHTSTTLIRTADGTPDHLLVVLDVD